MPAADASPFPPSRVRPRAAWRAAALAVLAIGCTSGPDRSGLQRRPVAPRSETSWTRLPLDAESLRLGGEPWIGDDGAQAVPSLRERPGLWGPRQLDIDKLLLGMDSEGRPSAEFTLRLPPGWSVRDREHLRIDLDLQGRTPWFCRVDVARRMEGPSLLGLPRESPLSVQDLGRKESVASILVPWDAREYRVVLQALAGTAPNIRSAKVTAVTDPAAMDPDRALAPSELLCEIPSPAPERWRIRLASPERVVGLEVVLKAPSAPVKPVVLLPPPGGDADGPARTLRSQDLVWNLPQKGGRGTRISLEPVLADRLVLALPAGARLDTVRVLVRADELLFPVQAGRRYWLHLGGRAKPAPDPGPLPPSRLIYARDPARVGPAGPDPEGLPQLQAPRRKTWLRRAALGAAAALAVLAVALLLRRRDD